VDQLEFLPKDKTEGKRREKLALAFCLLTPARLALTEKFVIVVLTLWFIAL